ncbi:LLM class F420-dependent oxidoreductase [Lentzea sp. E54]|uniref:LLM class F420-dependent oxidoreductase n=1 Tax=Lentzea xerophila TaxID=3435883 RepID=UPI003DA3669C
MRFGLLSPIVIRLPGAHSPWEADGGPEDLVAIAEHADALGYHHMTCSEHVGVPREVAETRGGTYWNPLATLAFLAARTRRLRLATNVLVLGYHHPLEIAKASGTLDRLSGGRVVLGMGVGTLEEEFALLGANFEDRGSRADDALRALRAAWATPVPDYDGPHFSFHDFVVDPHAVQPHVPVWIGGRTRRSLRRAVELGDGWMPFGLSGDEMASLLSGFDLPDDFQVVLQPAALDPLGDPDGTRRRVDAAAKAGATLVNAKFEARDRNHYLDQMTAFTRLYPDAWPKESH